MGEWGDVFLLPTPHLLPIANNCEGGCPKKASTVKLGKDAIDYFKEILCERC